MEGGEPIQLTKDKYGASNLNGPQMVKYCFHPAYHYDLLQDSILNPSKSITWKSLVLTKRAFSNQ
jgi:hypothetical protein